MIHVTPPPSLSFPGSMLQMERNADRCKCGMEMVPEAGDGGGGGGGSRIRGIIGSDVVQKVEWFSAKIRPGDGMRKPASRYGMPTSGIHSRMEVEGRCGWRGRRGSWFRDTLSLSHVREPAPGARCECRVCIGQGRRDAGIKDVQSCFADHLTESACPLTRTGC